MIDNVTFTSVSHHFDEDGSFRAGDAAERSARTLLDELHKWAQALRPRRA